MSERAAPARGNIRPFPASPRAGQPAGQTPHVESLDGIRALTDRGDLPPGVRVPERTLCQRFGVSRTPLREALKVLAAEGLVALLPNRGARIAALDEGELGHLFEAIAALEAEAGRLARSRIGEDMLAEIKGLHHRMYAHFLRRELPEYVALNRAIHEAILRAAANPVPRATHAGLASRVARARYMANRMHPDRWRAAMDEHGAVLDALCRRDGPLLAALLTRHLANKRDIVAAAIRGGAVGAAADAGPPGVGAGGAETAPSRRSATGATGTPARGATTAARWQTSSDTTSGPGRAGPALRRFATIRAPVGRASRSRRLSQELGAFSRSRSADPTVPPPRAPAVLRRRRRVPGRRPRRGDEHGSRPAGLRRPGRACRPGRA